MIMKISKGTIVKFVAGMAVILLIVFSRLTSTGLLMRDIGFWLVKPLLYAGVVLRQESALLYFNNTTSSEFTKNLIEENQGLKSRLYNAEKIGEEVGRLKKALKFEEERGMNLEGARVLLHTQEFGREFLLIDKGIKDGVREHQIVVDSHALLVGMVREATHYEAKIEIASNVGITYEVEITPIGVRAVARGMGGRTFLVELIPQETPVRRGDLLGAVLPQKVKKISLPLGEIITKELEGNGGFRYARAVLLAKPELLSEIFIIQGE